MNRLKKHLSPATVISCIALFVALSGAAYAAGLAKNSVKAKNIANGAVTTPKLKNASVTAAKLVNGSVIGSKIANGAVGSAKLAEASVRSSALGGGVVTTGKLKDLGVTEGKLASNSVTGTKIAAGSVETGKLAKEAITAEKIAAGLYAQLLKNVTYVTETSPSNNDDTRSVTATCPTGKEVLGGGARVTGANTKTVLTESAPFVNPSDKRIAWIASAREVEAESEPWAVIAYAICAEL